MYSQAISPEVEAIMLIIVKLYCALGLRYTALVNCAQPLPYYAMPVSANPLIK